MIQVWAEPAPKRHHLDGAKQSSVIALTEDDCARDTAVRIETNGAAGRAAQFSRQLRGHDDRVSAAAMCQSPYKSNTHLP